MKVEITVKIIDDSVIDGEYISLCPFCDQPINGGAIIVQHRGWGQMCLAHSFCVAESEEE